MLHRMAFYPTWTLYGSLPPAVSRSDRVGAGARAQRAPQLPGHCGWSRTSRQRTRTTRDKAPGSGWDSALAWPRTFGAMKVARTAAGAVVDARMNGVEAACDPDETCLHCVIVERRQLDTPRSRLRRGAQRGTIGGGEKPEPGKAALDGGEGEATCRARTRGGKLVTPVGIWWVGQAPAGEPRRCRCEPHGPSPPPHHCVSRSNKIRTQTRLTWRRVQRQNDGYRQARPSGTP